jgi:molybdopterin converting factor small subunit
MLSVWYADPQLAMKACPYRATFYPKLGTPESEVLPKLEAWLSALEEIVKREEGVFKAGNYGEI